MRRAVISLLAVAMVTAACATQVPSAGAPTAPAATSASAPPVRGGQVVFAIWQEPNTLYPPYATQTVASVVTETAIEGLTRVDTNGNFVPVLVKEVPTLQNGDVKISGDAKKMDVTYRLLPGVKWADGQPFTSADVKFNWETRMKDPKITSREGYNRIEAIDTPDATTAVAHFKEIYAPYLSIFTAIVPKHVLENEPDISKSAYTRAPFGTGPFKVTEFVSADHITVERNPNYRVKDKPLLDKIIFRSVPSREVAVAQLKAGEVDGMWNLLEAQVPDLQKDQNIKILQTASPTVERLEFNTAKPADPADAKVPHPVLGDLAMRRALLLATPKQQLIDKLLFGLAQVANSPISQGWGAPKDLKQESYDPTKAKQVLEDAGWKAGSDGIRTNRGIRASLTITTTTGDKVREQVEQILIDQWKQIGVELQIKNVPSSVLFGSWSQGAARKRGNFDINMYASSPDIDPHATINQRFSCDAIPTPENKGAGFNYNRFCDAKVDSLIEQGGATVDQEKRKQLYHDVLTRVNDQVLNVWLYERASLDAFRVNVGGYQGNVWDNVTFSTEDWFVKR